VPVSTIGYERMANGAWKTARRDGEQFVQEILAGQPDPPLYFKTMKRLNRDGAAVTNGPPSVPKLGTDEFKRTADKGAAVVDARDDIAGFAKGHFAKALHAPLHSPLFSAGTGSVLDEKEEILLVVESPEELDLAVLQLYRIGFDRVKGWITQSELEEMDLAGEPLERVQFAEFDFAKALEEAGILDVRTSAEFGQGHIEGAQSIPYTRLKERLDEVPRDKRLYIHCGSGKRAGIAASYLAAHGFSVVHVDGICERCREIAELEGVAH
jgi:hydroxyacylglutathione hydrolase